MEPEGEEPRNTSQISIINQQMEQLTINHTIPPSSLSDQPQGQNQHFNALAKQYTEQAFTDEDLPMLFESVLNNNMSKILYGLAGLRKLGCQLSTQVDEAIERSPEVMEKIIAAMDQQKYDCFQIQATWILTNYVGTRSIETNLAERLIPIFIKRLKSRNPKVMEQAMWGIGNLLADSSFCRQRITECGGLNQLVYLAKSLTLDNKQLANCVWAISNACNGDPLPNFHFIKNGLILLMEMVSSGAISYEKNPQIICDALWVINKHTTEDIEKIQMLIDYKLITPLIHLFSLNQFQYSYVALKILGNLSWGSQPHKEALLQHSEFLTLLLRALSHHKSSMRCFAVWTLANFSAGPDSHLEKVLTAPFVEKMFELLDNDVINVRQQIPSYFRDIAQLGTPKKVFDFYQQHRVITRLGLKLSSTESHKFLLQIIRSLEEILKVGNKFLINGLNPFQQELLEHQAIISSLQSLQYHENQRIYHFVSRVLSFFQHQEM